MSLLQQIAENLGATGATGASWMHTIAIQEGATGPVGGSWIQAWADAVGVTGPLGGSWIQALADHYGVTGAEGDWLIGIEVGTSGGGGEAPVNTVAPAITGTTITGETLSCSEGSWTGTATIIYTYQWKRNGSPIGSATNSSYVLVNDDVGTSVKCTVTATNDIGATNADSNTVTPTNPPLDPDAQAYLDAVEAAGGTINDTITDATDTLFVALKAASIYSKIDVFYPMIGGTYNSIRIEAKLQSTYDLTQSGSWTYSSNGARTVANTSGSFYLNTQYNPFTNLTSANSSYSTYWTNTNSFTPTNDRYFSGAYSGQTEFWTLNPYDSNGWNFIGYRNQEGPNVNPTTAGIVPNGGYFINSELNVSGTNTIQGLINTATYTSQAMGTPTGLPNSNFFLGNVSISGSPYQGTPGTYNFLHIGDGLTQAEMITLSTIVNTFQTTLGRNTY